MEGSAKLFDKFFKQHPPDRTKGPLAALHYDFYPFQESDVKWYEEHGCKLVKVCAEPGDLILWDSRTPHYNIPVKSQQDRFAIYTCFMPVSEASQEDLIRKKDAFERRVGTTVSLFLPIYVVLSTNKSSTGPTLAISALMRPSVTASLIM